MINVTVRTLDSGNYTFTLEDQSTVLALKHKIRDSLHFELHHQRLIYSGRVLADDINLTELDVDGKVIHMVQKAPPRSAAPFRGHSGEPLGAVLLGAPSPGTSSAGASTTSAGLSGEGPSSYQVPYEQIRPETMNIPFIPYMINDTDRRLTSIREFILDIDESLHDLNELHQPQNDASWENGYVRPRIGAITRPQTPQDFVEVVSTLEMTQAHIEPFRLSYAKLLRTVVSGGHNPHNLHLFRAYTEKMNLIHHSLAHMFHALSELSVQVDVSSNTISLVSEPAPNPRQPPLPVETMRYNNRRMNLGTENENYNPNHQNMDMDLEGRTTFILSSQNPMGDRNDLVNLPPQTTEPIVLGAIDFDSFVRSNQNPADEGITFSMNDSPDSPDDQDDSDSQSESDVMFVASDDQGFLQNITPYFTQEMPGTSRSSYLSEERFDPPSLLPTLPNLIYDRFLFCDNRYAHSALLLRRAHLMNSLEDQRRETSRNIENSLSVMINYVPGLTQDSVTSMTHLLCLPSFPETYMNAALTFLVRRFCCITPHNMQGNQLLSAAEFPKLHDHHRSLAINILMTSNDEPVDYIMNQLGRFLNTLPDITPLHEEFNLELSLRAYFNANLFERLLVLIAGMTNDIESVATYFINLEIFFIDVCAIIKHHCLNRVEGFCKAFDYFMHLLIEPMAERVKPLFKLLLSVIRNRVAIIEEPFERIHLYIHVREPDEIRLPTDNRFPVFEDCISLSSDDSVNNAQECTPIIDVPDDSAPSSDTIVQVLSNNENSTFEYTQPIVDVQPLDLATAGRRPMDSTTADAQSVITLSDEEPDSSFPPSGSSSVSENGNAKTIAAGDSNSSDAPEHEWEQSYVSIFKSDEVAQRAGGSNEPLSDAYLAGMPASRRRCVRRQRPPCNFEDFLTACVVAAGDSTHMTENDMRLALSVHMCNLGSTHFSSNEDVNEGETSRRFMYVRRYFTSDRPAPRGDDPNPSTSNHEDF